MWENDYFVIVNSVDMKRDSGRIQHLKDRIFVSCNISL